MFSESLPHKEIKLFHPFIVIRDSNRPKTGKSSEREKMGVVHVGMLHAMRGSMGGFTEASTNLVFDLQGPPALR